MVHAFFCSFAQLLITRWMLWGANVQSTYLTLTFRMIVGVFFMLITHEAIATITTQPSADCVACNGAAEVNAVFSGTINFEWYDENGSLIGFESNTTGISSIANLCPGIYQVQYTNGTENHTEWFSVGLPGQDAGDLVNLDVCTGTGNTNLFNRLEGSPLTGGTWVNPLGVPHNGVFNPANQPGGLYTYTVNVNGCSLQSGVYITVVQNADPGLSTTYLICENYEPFALTDVLAGSPDTFGQWFDGNQQPFSGTYDPATDATQLFTYMISVDDCPPVFSTMFVIENSLPNPGEDTQIAVCPNAIPFNMTQAMNGNADANGTWYNSLNQVVGPVFNPAVLPQGIYTYEVIGQTPCPSLEASLTIVFTDEISAGVPNPLALCSSDAPVQLASALSGNVSPGGVWTAPNGQLSNGSFDPQASAPGNYTYSVTAIGCQPVSSTVPVSIEQAVSAGEGTTSTVCESLSPLNLQSLLTPNATFGGQWLINGTPIPGNLVIEGGQSYPLQYQVIGNACPTDLANYLVNVDIQPNAGPDAAVELCLPNGFYDLSNDLAPNGGFETQLTAPDGSILPASILDLESAQNGAYTYTFISNNACPNDAATVQLTVELPPFVSGDEQLDLCYAGGEMDLNALSGGLPAGGDWTLNATPINSPVSAAMAQSGSYLYTFEAGAVCGTLTFELDLTLVEPLSAGDGAVLNVCSNAEPFNPETVLTNASPGGTWLFNGTPADDLTFDPSQNTSGVYTYVIPAIGPCPGQESAIEVIVDEGFAFSAGPDLEVCSMEGDVSFGINLCTNCTYDWTPSNLLENATTATPTFNVPFASQTTTYTFSVIASNGVCQVTDEVVFTVHPTPTLFVSGPSTLCDNETGLWNGAGAPELVWTVEGDEEPNVGSSIQINPSENFTLSLTGTNEFGCTNTTSFEVNVFESPSFDFVSPSADDCAPIAISLDLPPSDNPDLTLSWMLDGSQYTQNTLVELSQAGVYDLTLLVESTNGCANAYTTDAAIQVYPTPLPSFTYAPETLSALNPLVNFQNLTQDDADFVWDFGGMDESTAFSPSYLFPELPDMGYRVCLEATNSFGCFAESCQDLYFPGELLVYVPSAFTPDNDNLNEVFKPIVTGFEPETYRFSIYNRWGEQIFTTDNPNAAWNGSVNGGDYYAPNGAYVWTVEVTDAYSAERRQLKGHVTLIR